MSMTVLIALLLFQTFAVVAQDEGDEEKTIVAISEHQLGDQTLSLSAGLMIPLFFQEFGGGHHPTNLTLGGVGEIQWNAYVSPHVRLGGELGGAFSKGPNKRTLFMMPLTFKATYVFNVSRFEFPVFLGMGMNIVRYKDWSHLDFILKPGLAGYWRYDSNWSFGANAVWWLDFQRVANDQEGEARMGNFLIITPSVFYNF
jgi:hypothetical protein